MTLTVNYLAHERDYYKEKYNETLLQRDELLAEKERWADRHHRKVIELKLRHDEQIADLLTVLKGVAWKIDAYQSHWSATQAEREAIHAAIARAEHSEGKR